MIALLANPLARWMGLALAVLLAGWAYGLWRYQEGRNHERAVYEQKIRAAERRMAEAADAASRKEVERLAAVEALEVAQREFEDAVRGHDAVALPADLVRQIGSR